MNGLFLLILTHFFNPVNFTGNNPNTTGYNFKKPDQVLELPDILREISGLTYMDETTVTCIQDENGILFLYNINKGNIVWQKPFFADGDYEGITRIGKTIYVLRSDGLIYEIADYSAEQLDVKSYHSNIPATNNEGLCLDPSNNYLLIGCKSNIGKEKEVKDIRAIYSFDPASKKLSADPVYRFDVTRLSDDLGKFNIRIPSKGKKESKLKMRISAIAIHPVTKKLFVLSAVDRMLFIFEKNGTLNHIESFDQELYYKPEGITFLPSGDILITNEGKDRKPNLIRYNYRP